MNCNLCGSTIKVILDLGSHPIVNRLTEQPNFDAIKYPKRAAGCYACGLVQLYDEIDASLFYNNYATPSKWKNEPHLNILVDVLTSLIGKDKKFLDVGCNDGKFLENLRDKGWSNLCGLEPTLNQSEATRSKGFTVFNEMLTVDTANKIVAEYGMWDVVSSRQVLEHVSDLNDFGAALNVLLKKDGKLVLEIPDARVNLLHKDYTLWEEHVNYFTPETLEVFLAVNGFKVVDQYESIFAGGCITVIAERVENTEILLLFEHTLFKQKLNVQIRNFESWAANFQDFKNRVQDEVAIGNDHDQVILYGVGARSSNFVNIMGILDYVDFVVDGQFEKQGLYLPGSEKKVISAETYRTKLKTAPLFLLGVNAENEESLIAREGFPNGAKVFSILPPSGRLLLSWG